MADVKLYLGDCLEVMKTIPDCSVSSIITDPPYGLSDHKPQDVIDCLRAWLNGEPYQPAKKGFMGKSWDGWVVGPEVWREALRVLKPGGMLLCFAGTRSMDLVSMSIRLAGFELRDSIGYANSGDSAPLLAWAYGSGFPKSHDISKAIDKVAGAEREVIGQKTRPDGTQRTNAGNWANGMGYMGNPATPETFTAPATPAAQQWNGWGTSLKPAWEPVIMARKPLEGTVAANVLQWGVGGINVDGCRIGTADDIPERSTGLCGASKTFGQVSKAVTSEPWKATQGRWPANLLLDEVSAELLDRQSGVSKSTGGDQRKRKEIAGNAGMPTNGKHAQVPFGYGDTGGASRFFYVAKASKRDRDEGLEGTSNVHPTVKPTTLCRYLVRLVTPAGGVVLDPFAGSGSTLKAAILEGFNCIGIELDAEYIEIARRRIEHAQQAQMPLLVDIEH